MKASGSFRYPWEEFSIPSSKMQFKRKVWIFFNIEIHNNDSNTQERFPKEIYALADICITMHPSPWTHSVPTSPHLNLVHSLSLPHLTDPLGVEHSPNGLFREAGRL